MALNQLKEHGNNEKQEIITELYRIQASIPLTLGKVARAMIKELIKKLEGDLKHGRVEQKQAFKQALQAGYDKVSKTYSPDDIFNYLKKKVGK